jgi:hypothetical protein
MLAVCAGFESAVLSMMACECVSDRVLCLSDGELFSFLDSRIRTEAA